jgi:hypothetical protein
MELEPFCTKNLTFAEDDSKLRTNIIIGRGARFFGSRRILIEPGQIPTEPVPPFSPWIHGSSAKKEGNAYGY